MSESDSVLIVVIAAIIAFSIIIGGNSIGQELHNIKGYQNRIVDELKQINYNLNLIWEALWRDKE